MDALERDYFLARAEAELDLGNEARHENSAFTHFRRAFFYLDRAHQGSANEN